MRLSSALEDKLLDIRLRDKFLAEGKITKELLQEYLNTLVDEGDNFEMVEVKKRDKKSVPVES